jgi:hypothetical protein
MSEFDTYETTRQAGTDPLNRDDWTSSREIRWNGAEYTEQLPKAANANVTEMHVRMTVQLPLEIQGAIREWADHLRTLPWNLRRRAIQRFAGSFADNFLATVPNLTDEEYESLSDIGTTCILEQLDDGSPMQDPHQARCYLDSVHEHHQAMARAYLSRIRPTAVTLH